MILVKGQCTAIHLTVVIYYSCHANTEETAEENRKQTKIKMEEVQSALQAANSQLLAVEKDQRHAKATLEQREEDVKVIKTIMEEEQMKADNEIAVIVSTFEDMGKVVLARQDQLNASISVY